MNNTSKRYEKPKKILMLYYNCNTIRADLKHITKKGAPLISNNLQIFQSPEFGSHRFIEIDGEIWIAGIDVCNVLEYKIPQKAITDHVDEEDRLRLSYQELQTIQNGSFEIPTRGLTFINISGFLSLVLSSKLPGAKRYRRWVTSEVLPAIHKNGFYFVEKRDSYMIENKIERAKRWIEEEEERQRLIEENNELKPKASYYDEVLKCDNLVTTTEIAKAYGKSAVWLNEFLREHDVQYYLKGQKVWILKAQYAHQGYAHLESIVVPSRDRCQQHLKWTQKGRMFLYEFLKTHGIFPTCKKE